ncbi:hypothetical protein O2W18_07475 [Modestobacter sp. VKM Ac-2983]|uniref:hypothetical protein n=1 Tax=Modestobacter sp. VKM Ac-2983 TaxID=3004137 RepID=UPI0022ABA3FE|nr:hypothetical protein [Modestobacter sp. VKM Ac-2983]MCZ2804933.1 hypothetical protein [Modestobacter sp. VKM Ac-2983]
MSTDSTTSADPTQEVPAQPGATPVVPVDDGTVQQEQEPGFVSRHTTSLITVLVAVIVAALAIGGLSWYHQQADDANADTEAAFVAVVGGQGATVETVECDGDTCAAVIGGQAYTVLVQEDEGGEQHFGVAAYSGD